MAYITSFKILGLNGRKKPIAAELNRGVNVFFGSNGSGKTSILRIIDSALSGDASSISDINFTKAVVKFYSEKWNKEFTLTCDKNTPPQDVIKFEELEYEVAVYHDSAGQIVRELQHRSPSEARVVRSVSPVRRWEISPLPEERSPPVWRWEHVYLSTARLYAAADRQTAVTQTKENLGFSERALDKKFSDAIQAVWGQRFGQITQRVSQIQEEGLQKVLAEVLAPRPNPRRRKVSDQSAPDAERAYERMARFLSRQSRGALRRALGDLPEFVQRYETEPHLRNIVRLIDDVETRIDLETQPIRSLSRLIEKLFSGGKRISFEGPVIRVVADDGSQIGISRLSSGEKHVIKILLSAMESGVSSLIIDEPEISMHIDWQRNLIENIRSINPECQLICATHSPEIMADIKDEEIFRI